MTLLVRLPVNSRLPIFKFWGSHTFDMSFSMYGDSIPIYCTVEESNV